jgi:hypothetical protein
MYAHYSYPISLVLLIGGVSSHSRQVSDINKLRESGLVTIGQVLQTANRYQ